MELDCGATLEIDLVCASCGADLDGDERVRGRLRQVHITPCADCLRNERVAATDRQEGEL